MKGTLGKLDRRGFLGASLAAAGTLTAPAVLAAPARIRRFAVTTEVELPAGPEAAQLWLPVFQSAAGQRPTAPEWATDAASVLSRETRYGAELVHTRWGPASAPRRLTLVQEVATWERTPSDTSVPLSAVERALWTRLDGTADDRRLLRGTAARIVGGRTDPREKARAIYDWVVTKTWRDPAVPACGKGDAVAMLREGRTGGKCADINGLMVCLARAAGMPAREVFGLRVASSSRFPSLGRSGDVTGAQHCRAEVWLDGQGWLAVDPADVRKAVLEEKLAVGTPQIVGLADTLFGTAESNWIGYNSAGHVALPGALHPAPYRFLMYPTAMTRAGLLTPTFRILAHEFT